MAPCAAEAVVPFCVVLVSAGLPNIEPVVAAGAVVPVVAVVEAGAVVVAPPNRLLDVVAAVVVGAEDAGVAPNIVLLVAGAGADVAGVVVADGAAAPPKRLPAGLGAEAADVKRLGAAAVLAGAAALVVAACSAGFWPNRLEVVVGVAAAGCVVAAEAPPKIPPVVEVADSGFLPNMLPALLGAAAGVLELACENRLLPAVVAGCVAGVLPKRLVLGASPPACAKVFSVGVGAFEACCPNILDAAGLDEFAGGAPAGVVEAKNIGFAGVP